MHRSRRVESSGSASPHPRRDAPLALILGVAVGYAVSLILLGTAPIPPSHPAVIVSSNTKVSPDQGGQLYTFTGCTAPDGSSCLSPYGGVDTPLDVGTTVALQFFSSAFCTTPITGYVDWGDGSSSQPQTIDSGPCQCTFGPFSHTYNMAGTFPLTINDTCDGPEAVGNLTVSGADTFSFDGALIAFGGILGLGALIGAAVSLRKPRIAAGVPAEQGSASIIGFYPPSPAPGTGVRMEISPPPPGLPLWATDYRTTPYQPNPLIQGWAELRQKFPPNPAPPNWPLLTNPAPPTGFPGVFYQPRFDGQTNTWRWWNPVDGTWFQ